MGIACAINRYYVGDTNNSIYSLPWWAVLQFQHGFMDIVIMYPAVYYSALMQIPYIDFGWTTTIWQKALEQKMFSIQTKYIVSIIARSIGFSVPSIVKMINHYSLVFHNENNNIPSWVMVQMDVPVRHLFIDPVCHPRRVQQDNNSDNSSRSDQRHSPSLEKTMEIPKTLVINNHIQPKWIFWKLLLFFSSTCRLCPCG